LRHCSISRKRLNCMICRLFRSPAGAAALRSRCNESGSSEWPGGAVEIVKQNNFIEKGWFESVNKINPWGEEKLQRRVGTYSQGRRVIERVA
jgi:hypothetical protein